MNDITTKDNALIQWLSKSPFHHFLTQESAHYPPLLKEIHSPPKTLYVKGDLGLLSKPQIAMVGSRRPSPTGFELANEFAYLLAQKGLCITSGLALGIDTASHQGALNAQGKTIAVLGSGLECCYPKTNAKLAEKIAENGCLVSEFPIHMPPIKENFPRRNRIISGLSLGTLVVEAALKSGSLITARFAMEHNRDVFAIPGSIRNPLSSGCLALIQQGAKCVAHVDDILTELKLEQCDTTFIRDNKNKSVQNAQLDQNEQRVLACTDDVVATIDQICARSKLSPQKVTAILLELELSGAVSRHPNGYTKQI